MSKIYAHRGFSYRYAENSLESVQDALSYEFIDGVEIDIRMTKDNEFVLIHDKTIDNLSNGKGFVSNYTLKELKKLTFHTSYSDYKVLYLRSFKYKDGFKTRKRLRKIIKHKYKVCKLEDVLNVMNNKILLIEIKAENDNDFNLNKFLELVNHYPHLNIMIQSFNINIIKKLKKLTNNYKLGILIGESKEKEKLSLKTDFISIIGNKLNNNILTNELYKKKDINVWTVDYFSTLKNVIKNIDGKINEIGLITNNPDLMYKYLIKVNKK